MLISRFCTRVWIFNEPSFFSAFIRSFSSMTASKRFSNSTDLDSEVDGLLNWSTIWWIAKRTQNFGHVLGQPYTWLCTSVFTKWEAQQTKKGDLSDVLSSRISKRLLFINNSIKVKHLRNDESLNTLVKQWEKFKKSYQSAHTVSQPHRSRTLIILP